MERQVHRVSPRDKGRVERNGALLPGMLVSVRLILSQHDWPGRTQGWGPCCESYKPSVSLTRLRRLTGQSPCFSQTLHWRPFSCNNAGDFQDFITSVRIALNLVSNS